MAVIAFDPDYVVAPAAVLQEWMDDHCPNLMVLASLSNPLKPMTVEELSTAIRVTAAAIQEVLDRKPLTPTHADMLRRGTQVPARFWLAFEYNYRAGLMRGLKDMT